MAEHFLVKTKVDLADCLVSGAELAVEQYETLVAFLTDRAGPSTARLFAEPLISRGNDVAPPTIAWYSDFEGEGRPYSELDESARADLSDVLSRRLAPLADLVDDGDAGRLVRAALNTLDPDSVWSVGGRPVILNWGMLPRAMQGDERATARHFKATLGRFMALEGGAAVAPAAGGPSPVGASPVAPAAVPAAPVVAASAASPPPRSAAVAVSRGRVPLYAWLPLVILLLLAGGVLTWLLMPGTRLFAAQPPARFVSEGGEVEVAASVNAALEARIKELEQGLAGATCQPDGTLLMPDGVTIEGMASPAPATPMEAAGTQVAVAGSAVLPGDPARLQTETAASARESLLKAIEERTVLVIVRSPRGISTGSGFFVGPGLIVTNDHVVEGALPDGILVSSAGIGKAVGASVLKASGPFSETGADFALLQVEDTRQPAYSIYLPDESLKLNEVFAAGFPGDVMQTDAHFTALRQGTMDSVPDLTITDGSVNTEQDLTASTLAFVHSAPISEGNSGGPLVDSCGRVVGVNTFVRKGPMRNLNFALSARDLLAFLKDTPVTPVVVTQACRAEILRPSVAAAAAEPAPPDPSAPAAPLQQLPILPKKPANP